MTAAAQNTPGTAVATRDKPKGGITALFTDDKVRARVMPLLLPGASYERVLGEIQLLAKENPAILNCTGESLVRAVSRAVTWGGTIGEDVHIVPFRSKMKVQGEDGREREEWVSQATAMMDYKFKAELIVRAGGARSIDAQCVYANEPFVYEQGAYPKLEHRPILNPAQRGALVGAYAVAQLGQRVPPKILVLSSQEIDSIRRQFSKQWKPKDGDGPQDCPPWYAMKCCVHRLAKLLPKNPKLTQLLGRIADDDELSAGAFEDEGPVAVLPAPVASPQRLATGEVEPSPASELDDESDEEIRAFDAEIAARDAQGR